MRIVSEVHATRYYSLDQSLIPLRVQVSRNYTASFWTLDEFAQVVYKPTSKLLTSYDQVCSKLSTIGTSRQGSRRELGQSD